MDRDKDLEVVLVRKILFVTITLFAVSLFFASEVALGFLLGGLASILYVRLLSLSVQKLTRMPPALAARYAFRSYVGRYIFFMATLVVAGIRPEISFWAAVAGLLLPKLLIIILCLKPSPGDS